MKVLTLYDYPPSPGGLATQGHLLHDGLIKSGVNARGVNFESDIEKEWYYHWFKPDLAVGIGYWGHTPHLILEPLRNGILPVPWLVADGYIANYQKILNDLPLILVTSHWVKQMYIRDGIRGDNIEVLPVGCDTDSFVPADRADPKVIAVRTALGIAPDEMMILTVGGDAASKGAREMMRALSQVRTKIPPWKYVCKVWPQKRTNKQNKLDLKLAEELGISDNVIYSTSKTSRSFMPYLLGACDIYAAPSRLEGFGMTQIEAGACEKPVISLNAMGMLDTLIHNKTALLANVEREITIQETILGKESGFRKNQKIVFDQPRVVDYRASVQDIATHLITLMNDEDLRIKLGKNGRQHVMENFDYRIVARRFIDIVHSKLDIFKKIKNDFIQ